MAELQKYTGDYIKNGNRFASGAADGIATESQYIASYIGDATNAKKFGASSTGYLTQQQFNDNVITQINSVSTGVENVQVGIKSVDVSGTLSPNVYDATITVTGNNGISKYGYINVDPGKIVQSITVTQSDSIKASFGKKTTLSTISGTLWDNNSAGTGTVEIQLPDCSEVYNAWNKSSSYTIFEKGIKDADTSVKISSYNYIDAKLDEAKKYTDNKVSAVYKPMGSVSYLNLSKITNGHEGDVYNVTEKFKIDGKQYAAYTNVVFVKTMETALSYDSKNGWSGEEVDALGGMFDQSAIEDSIVAAYNKSIVGLSGGGRLIGQHGDSSTVNITPTLGNGTTAKPVSVSIQMPTLEPILNEIVKQDDVVSNLHIVDNGGGYLSFGFQQITAKGISDSSIFTIEPASNANFGLVKTDSSLNNTDGVIGIPKNTFKEGDAISITNAPNSSNGQDFTITLNYATKQPNVALSIDKDNKLTITDNGLDDKLTTLTNNLNDVTTRLGYLEALLTLS